VTEAYGEKKKAHLSDDDDVWVQLRHQHILDVKNHVSEAVKTLSKYAEQIKQDGFQSASRMIRHFPDHQEKMSRYNTHLDLCGECFHLMKKRKIPALSDVEQDIAMGFGYHRSLLSLFSDPEFRRERAPEIIRILLLSLACAHDRDCHEALMLAAQLPPGARAWIEAFQKRYLAEKQNVGVEKKRRFYLLEKLRRLKTGDRGRFEPVLKTILTDLIEGKMNSGKKSEKFPVVASRNDNAAPWTAKSKSLDKPENAPLVICYIDGGVTYSETRVAFEVSDMYPVDVIVGGDCILTPRRFVDRLGSPSVADFIA